VSRSPFHTCRVHAHHVRQTLDASTWPALSILQALLLTPAEGPIASLQSVCLLTPAFRMIATELSKDTRDTPMRRTRHRDGKLKGGVGLTTGLGWSDRSVLYFNHYYIFLRRHFIGFLFVCFLGGFVLCCTALSFFDVFYIPLCGGCASSYIFPITDPLLQCRRRRTFRTHPPHLFPQPLQAAFRFFYPLVTLILSRSTRF
jgi:hypothetical protein